MAGRLEGKVALITGGVSGIGLGTVELFAKEGACVVAADLQDEKGAMLEKRFDGRIRYAHCDVTSEKDIAGAVKMAADQFGGLDILFNNAGHGGAPGLVSEVDVEAWDATFALLVRGPAVGMKHAMPLMVDRGGGSIINTASIAGLQAGFGPLAYSAAKCAVIHMSRCAAAELSPKKIRVNAICPGTVDTPSLHDRMREQGDYEKARAAFIARQAMGRLAQPEEIGKLVVYLASDESAFITGQFFVIDGGWTL